MLPVKAVWIVLEYGFHVKINWISVLPSLCRVLANPVTFRYMSTFQDCISTHHFPMHYGNHFARVETCTYGKFIPDLASLVHPLNKLLQVGSTWSWFDKCEQAFALAKEKLTSATVLASSILYVWQQMLPHMDLQFGAVISHILRGL